MSIKTTTIPLLDFPIYRNDLHQIDWSTKKLINTINQYSFCIAQEDVAFKKALQGSDVLLLDLRSIYNNVIIKKDQNNKNIRYHY